MEQVYNRTTNTVDIDEIKLKAKTDFFAIFGDHATETARLNAEMTGAVIPEYHGGFDSDTDSDNENEDEPRPKPSFDLKMIFNLTPSLAGAGGMDDQNSIGTNATGTSNATQLILEGGIDARFDNINLDGEIVDSSLKEPIQNTPPHQPRQLNTNSDEHDSREQEEQKEEDDKTEQEEQKEEENKMELDNDGTKKDNKEENQTDPDAIIAEEDGSNGHEGKNRRNNGNNDNIDNYSEKSKKESNDKEGGRRGVASGRGRGSYHLGIQDDKGGRGGNHSQGTKGSNIDTSHNNTNTIVVHQKDDTAQSRGKNEQEPIANGKSGNVSTSLQQTGAAEDAAG